MWANYTLVRLMLSSGPLAGGHSEAMTINAKREWTILSNHGMVLLHLAAHPDLTQRELAHTLGITENRVGTIVRDLELAGMIGVERGGWRNSYRVNPEACLPYPTLSHIPLRRLIEAVTPRLIGEHEAAKAE